MTITNYPVKKMVIPSALKNEPNGKINKKLLKKTVNGAWMWENATFSFDLMYKEARDAGIRLINIGDYRSYRAQERMFKQRYSTKDLGRKPKVTRRWNGVVYYLKPGKSPSAVPGTSNHGFALACDLAIKNEKGKVVSLASDSKAMKWMCNNAPRFGFYLQGLPTLPSGKPNPEWEAWHWQYCAGDTWPPASYEAIIAYVMALEANKPK